MCKSEVLVGPTFILLTVYLINKTLIHFVVSRYDSDYSGVVDLSYHVSIYCIYFIRTHSFIVN